MNPNDLDQLAAKLHRPPASFAAFAELAPEHVATLSKLIDAACARERRAVEEAFERALPALPRALLLELLGGGER